ncbi:MAG TPA: PAS domain S-box protein [Gallionella sp.]|nr:PAS domain S-box protein [Gallionella sp.]
MGLTDGKIQDRLRVLHLEDNPNDRELIRSELEAEWPQVELSGVATRAAFLQALDEFKPDLILSDYRLPDYDGRSALTHVRQHHPEIPVIMVSGALGETEAVELVKMGARDYVMKGELQRLPGAVKSALSEEYGIRARKAAEKALWQSEADLRALVESSPIAMIVDVGMGADQKVVMMNRQFIKLFGYTMADVPDIHHWWQLAYPDEQYREKLKAEWADQAIRKHGAIEPKDVTVTCKDGSSRYVRISLASAGNRNIVTFEDLTAGKLLEDALQEAVHRNQVMMETVNDAIVCIDQAGIIYLWNLKAEEMFGYSAAEAIGQDLHSLITPARYYESSTHALGKFAQTGTGPIIGVTRQIDAKRKDGSEFPVELSVSAMSIQGTWHATGIIRDITERKQAESRIARLVQLYAALSQCNQAIVRSKNPTDLFEQICHAAVTFGGFKMAWVGLIDPGTGMVKPVFSFGEGAEEYLRGIQISISIESEFGQGPTGCAIRENKPFWCQDFMSDPLTSPWHDRAIALGWKSSAALPLSREGAVIGAFTLYGDEVNQFDADERKLLVEMAEDVSYALDNFRHETERKQTEDALVESNNLLKAVIQTSPMRIFWKDRELRYLGCNAAFARDAGEKSPAEIVGKDDYQLGWKAQASLYRADDNQVMESGIPMLSYDELQSTPDGRNIWLRTSKVPLRNAANEIIGVLGIYEDITERKLVELALQRSEADLNRAQAVAQVGSWNLDILSNRLEWSAEACRIFGIPGQEAVDLDTFISTIHPDDREMVLKAWEAAIAGEPYDIEHRVVADGVTRWVRERAVIERDAAGHALFGVGTTQDITERRLAEDQLRKLSLAVEQSPNSIVITDLNANLEYVNEAFLWTTGYSREEVIGKNPRILHSDKTPRETYDDMWAHLARGDSWKGEFTNRRKNGGEYIESIFVSPVRDSDGTVTHYVGIKEDITERKKVEKSLQESEEKFRVMSASAQDGIVMIDNDGNISFWNRAAENIFGYSASEALGKNLHLLLSPVRFHEASDKGFAQFQDSGKGAVIGKTLELMALHNSGKEFPLELSLSAVNISGLWQAIGIVRDISERKENQENMLAQYSHVAGVNAQLMAANKQLEQTQKQLLQSEKMAAVGLLAAGVAHEINNPVGYVNSNLGTLEKYLADIFVDIDKYEAAEAVMAGDNLTLDEVRQLKARIDLAYLREDIKALLAESHQGLERVKKIVLDLKEFSHSDAQDQWVWADVHHGLDTTLSVVWNELKYKCEVVKEYGDLPKIYCLPSQLNQVFMNLLVNAAQAIEVRGKITLRTGLEGDRIWVEVSDTGHGISPEHIPRLFDPFFTTKPVGQGTGLGLSVSYNIVEKHHGSFEVHSEIGRGTTFRVWLPVQQSDNKEKA